MFLQFICIYEYFTIAYFVGLKKPIELTTMKIFTYIYIIFHLSKTYSQAQPAA